MDNKLKTAHLARLVKMDEWKTFVKHIEEISKEHQLTSAKFAAQCKDEDARRQAWISEGLMESIEEPQRFVNYENSLRGNIAKFCKECGTRVHEFSERLTLKKQKGETR